jgi:hypothetical protein
MGVRTAQFHDPTNRAFERAVQSLREAADALYAATNGFQLSYVEDAVFLNGVRLRGAAGTFDAMRALRRIFESHHMGGIEARMPPTYDLVRKLVLLLAKVGGDLERARLDLSGELEFLAVQRLSGEEDEAARPIQVDRRVFALQCYAKLILAFRDQVRALRLGRKPSRRLRAIRIVQDVIELAHERLDFILRMGMNRRGADPDELHAANVALLSISMGQALGLSRQTLVDIGTAGLLHDLGRHPMPPPHREERRDGRGHPHVHASFARLLSAGGVARSNLVRAAIVSEHHYYPGELLRWGEQRPLAHLGARIVAVADTFDSLSSGLGTADGKPMHPVDALKAMLHPNAPVDPILTDLLINLLRAFPVGVQVLLDSGDRATVRSHLGGSRWDRPIITIERTPPFNMDLMVEDSDRYRFRIVQTLRSAG